YTYPVILYTILFPLILLLFFFYCYAPHRDLHSFPTRRSSDLGNGLAASSVSRESNTCNQEDAAFTDGKTTKSVGKPTSSPAPETDRKSTRLNSSHVSISYAVFCLKKKKKKNTSKHKVI